jgi:hypothetical protein
MDNWFVGGAKRITVRQYGKVLYEFLVTKKELKLAAKLGVSPTSYIIAKAKLNEEKAND